MSNRSIQHIVIVGGGSAGWMTAGVLAAEHQASIKATNPSSLKITLVESPDISPVGVGEGTWPTMRATLKKIGVSETAFFRECEASFKQGAKFSKWVTGADDDYYYHPLMLPVGFQELDLTRLWRASDNVSFGDFVCLQGSLCEKGLAPKQIKTPEFEGIANYAYHLSSEKFGQFLKNHCVEKLGVKHIVDHVVAVQPAENGDISALRTAHSGDINGDLFIDCSGASSVLLGGHYQIPFKEKHSVLFNDYALAVQVPYLDDQSPIASHTIATAHKAGWIWDIGLPSRRGVGSVYSSAHASDDEVHRDLLEYISDSVGKTEASKLSVRKIQMHPGHREIFWHRNCVGVGMSAGFLEPLEASALVLVETAAAMISAKLPANRKLMDIVARQFNQRFQYYWDSIIDFLKMHYVLTRRSDSRYWRDHLNPESIPNSLQERLELWRHQVPNRYDFPWADEMFPPASWQYVLYGMGFNDCSSGVKSVDVDGLSEYSSRVQLVRDRCLSQLPSNRELIDKIYQYGMQKI